jgi:hypothetical protein
VVPCGLSHLFYNGQDGETPTTLNPNERQAENSVIFGLSGHFHMEVNLEMIPNLSWRAAEIGWFIPGLFFVHN